MGFHMHGISVLTVLLVVLSSFTTHAFLHVSPPPPSKQQQQLRPLSATSSSSSRTFSSFLRLQAGAGKNNEDDNKGAKKTSTGLDTNVRTKLIGESIAPWRTLRLFLYGSAGSGALLGGIITATGLAAVLSGAQEGNVQTELLNLGIDFGAVLAFALLFKFDLDKQLELTEKVEERIEKKKEQKKLVEGMKQREQQLGRLRLDVQISPDGTTRDAGIRELQAGARQHMIIIAGPKKACRDALVGANLLKMDFAMSNILVVPYEVGGADLQSRPEGGFGERPMYETQPYVARPTGEGWDEYIQAEMADAVEQNGEKTKEEGIAIVVSSTGNVIRRGVGKVPWRQMVQQLDTTVGGGPEKEPSLF